MKEPLVPQPPPFLPHLEWLKIYGWRYRLYLIVGALLLLFMVVISHWPDLLRFYKTERLTATATEFDTENWAISLRLDNRGDFTEMIQDIYYTLKPQGRVTLRPLPESLSYLLEGAPNGGPIIAIPARGGFETIDGWLRLNSWLSEKSTIVIENGKPPISMNLTPLADSFRGACDVFSDGTSLDLGIHFCLVDASGGRHDVDMPLGTYSRETGKSSLVRGTNFPVRVNLLPSPVIKWRRYQQYTVTIGTNWTQIGMPAESSSSGGHEWRRFRNYGAGSLFISLGQPEINYSAEAVRLRP